jgi:hypothetical protein
LLQLGVNELRVDRPRERAQFVGRLPNRDFVFFYVMERTGIIAHCKNGHALFSVMEVPGIISDSDRDGADSRLPYVLELPGLEGARIFSLGNRR